MKNLKQKIAIALILSLCFTFCFFGAGCGENLNFENGEYVSVLVADSPFLSWAETDFPVKIENNELTVYGNNYGQLSKGKLSSKNWKETIQTGTHNGFKLDEFKGIKYCLKTKIIQEYNYSFQYCITENNGKIYLLRVKEQFGFLYLIKMWSLQKANVFENEANIATR